MALKEKPRKPIPLDIHPFGVATEVENIAHAIRDYGTLMSRLMEHRGIINDDTHAGLLRLSYEVVDMGNRLIELTPNVYEHAREERQQARTGA